MNDINQIITLLEQAKQLSDEALSKMKPHTREYLYFDNLRNGIGQKANEFKKYLKMMEEQKE